MFLVKNKLKRVKNKYDDDEMLNYLKYSHLEPKNTTKSRMAEVLDKATQEPDILNNFSQTVKKDVADKETDTYDELNKIISPYILQLNSKNFKSREPSRGELMTQARTVPIQKNDEEGISISDVEDFISRNATRGFRLAQALGNVALTTGSAVGTATELTLDTLMYLYNLSQQQHSEEEEEQEEEEHEEEQEEEQASGSTDASPEARELRDQATFRRERSRSHDTDYEPDDDLGERLLRRGASRSRSSTPDRGYPKKKYK